jgi:tetratricopeptide (TPR) repeat protein
MNQKIKKIFAVFLMVCYLLVFYYILQMLTDHPLAVILAMLVSIPFMVVTHETGHLIFGLLTGYKFVSFRIFSVMLLRENGKYKWKKQSVPGTAGQCLMAPPRKKNGYYPYKLYNLGGCLFCGILSFIPMVLSLFLTVHPINMPLFIFGFVSFFMNLMNAIPTNGKSMLNDATNLRMANKSIPGREAFWNQLEYIHLHAKHLRTADMPESMFFHPHENDLGNPLVQWQSMANIERYEDMGDYEKAQAEVNHILEKAPFLHPMYEDYFKTEAVYLGALLGNNGERVEKYENELKKRNLAKNSVNSARAQYAYQKLIRKDIHATDTALKFFEKKIEKEPYQASKDFERRQMEYIDRSIE